MAGLRGTPQRLPGARKRLHEAAALDRLHDFDCGKDMRKLVASTFTSLDGVMQAPGGPDEDPAGNFQWGGWSFAFWDDGMELAAAGFDGKGRELLLGRKTYEIFARYWPLQPQDHEIAKTFNAARKHVASRTLNSLQWNNASLLAPTGS